MDNYPDYETVDYHVAYGELIQAARAQGTVTYQQLAQALGLPTHGNYMGNRMGGILGAVSLNEFNQNRPLLSAVAVTVNGMAGKGFFTLARDLGLLDSDDPETERAFWEEQKRLCYQIWRQKFPK